MHKSINFLQLPSDSWFNNDLEYIRWNSKIIPTSSSQFATNVQSRRSSRRNPCKLNFHNVGRIHNSINDDRKRACRGMNELWLPSNCRMFSSGFGVASFFDYRKGFQKRDGGERSLSSSSKRILNIRLFSPPNLFGFIPQVGVRLNLVYSIVRV